MRRQPRADAEEVLQALYRLNVKLRKKYLSQFIADAAIAAE